MREILFRGKRTDNKQWVEGFYALIGEENPNAYIITSNGHRIRVAHKSISQYTGLTDKNGTKIFEGGIVKISADLNENYACVWEKYNFEYVFENKTMSFSICGVRKDDIEVIGNIHDNPELLKGE